MLLNLNDVDSILRWWRVLPERHDGVLEQMRMRPQFAPAIMEAQRRISSCEALQSLLRSLRAQREQQDADQAEQTSRLSSVQMLRRELSVAR